MPSSSSRAKRAFTTLVALIGLGTIATGIGIASTTGCSAPPSSSSGKGTVTPHLEIINQTKNALAGASITALYGKYTSCVSHVDDDVWIAGAGSDLTVVKGDTACLLTVTDVITAGPVDYTATTPLPLTVADTYNATPSTFKVGAGPVAFYGNAKIAARTYVADFQITVLVSDDPTTADAGSKAANWATQTATLQQDNVPAPDYTIAFPTFDLTQDVNNEVQTAVGTADLTLVGQAAEDYVVTSSALTGASTFADVDTAWGAGADAGGGGQAMPGGLALAAAEFSMVGATLPQSRTVILRHTASGVRSYQLIFITFTP